MWSPTNHSKLNAWVAEMSGMCQPDSIVWCDGSKDEYQRMCNYLIAIGCAVPLNPAKRPGCLHFRSDPSDVARVEDRTYIACKNKEDAGPTNNWMEPEELKKIMRELYKGCMKGRTMYVIPFLMGPHGSPFSKVGVEITDSAYVVINMHIMTRVGGPVLKNLGTDGTFVPCMHTIGSPLAPGQKDVAWPCAPIEKKYISHFPEEDLIWSYGSGYGGNALLGKKCFALRIASNMARREGWMAEHMLIMRLVSPTGKKFHCTAAFPSACGKTNLAMLQPTLAGWRCECLGDDISWMRPGKDNKLFALNPEAGFFGVAPGTSYKSNPMAMESIKCNTIYTNCVVTDDLDVWWEDMDAPCKHGIDWKGQEWTPGKTPGAHPNARFTAPAHQCPIICADWESPEGVPIDFIIFGGRRAKVAPLVHESYSWDHGVYLGSTAASETTAANIGAVGNLRRDPMAMTPFCGYNMGDYWQHWLDMGDKLGANAPKVFYVNWFRKSAAGKFLWPGYGENCRVLKWMSERVEGKVSAVDTAIGRMPTTIDTTGLDVSDANMKELLQVDNAAWKAELADVEQHYGKFGARLPARLRKQLDDLKQRLG